MRNNWLEILYFYLSFVTLTTIEIEIKQKEKKNIFKKTFNQEYKKKLLCTSHNGNKLNIFQFT